MSQPKNLEHYVHLINQRSQCYKLTFSQLKDLLSNINQTHKTLDGIKPCVR